MLFITLRPCVEGTFLTGGSSTTGNISQAESFYEGKVRPGELSYRMDEMKSIKRSQCASLQLDVLFFVYC